MEDKKILVFYIGVGDLPASEVGDYIYNVRTKFFTQDFIKSANAEIILLPVRDVNSRVECINPKYITNQELIDEHKTLMIDYLAEMNKVMLEKEGSKND